MVRVVEELTRENQLMKENWGKFLECHTRTGVTGVTQGYLLT